MLHAREKQIDDAFFALSHPMRRGIVEKLAKGDLSVADVSGGFSESPSQITKHLHILERAGMLSRKKKGRVHQLHFEPEPLEEMMAWVSHYQNFWLVFEAWTKKEYLRQWMGPTPQINLALADVDLKEGGTYSPFLLKRLPPFYSKYAVF